MAYHVLYFIFLTFLIIPASAINILDTLIESTLPEDGRLNFTELAKKYGFPAKEYEVITSDGYILKLFNIPGKNGLPVLLMHGLAASADCWIIRGERSLAVTLAKSGYDLWFGNIRGNKYSRKHVNLNPDTDEAFWDFSFHENGYYDLPAIVERVLKESKTRKLNAIGYSQGTTIFYVLCSTRPEYNSKINFMMGLASVAFLNNIQPPLSRVISVSSVIYNMLKDWGFNELFYDKSMFNNFLKVFCSVPSIGYRVCMEAVTFPIVGRDTEEVKSDFVPVIFGHYPTSTALKSLYHYAQISNRKTFSQFDYGLTGNLIKYNSLLPPVYNLNLVTTKIIIYAGLNDKLSTIADVDVLISKLPNVVRYIVSPWEKCNHVDYVWGKNTNLYLFPYILEVLRLY
ncbi:lipase 1-like [Battus philenor]|uniref:lipase 1-like n=1 Tax=Battus philenor TaxID=42288 RepID=UPI0035D0C89A